MISVAHDEPATIDTTTRSVASALLGPLEVSESAIMSFPTPLWGFPDHGEFALVPAAREGLWWLQSLASETLTFLLADPFVLDANYGVDLGETERSTLHIEQPTDAFGLVMVTLPAASGETVTANFRAPLVFNLARRVGMQIVGRDESYDLRRPVSLDVFPAQANGVRLR